MAKPVIWTVDDDADVLRAVERDLRRQLHRRNHAVTEHSLARYGPRREAGQIVSARRGGFLAYVEHLSFGGARNFSHGRKQDAQPGRLFTAT